MLEIGLKEVCTQEGGNHLQRLNLDIVSPNIFGYFTFLIFAIASNIALFLSVCSTHSLIQFGVSCFLVVVDVGALPNNDLCAQPVGLPRVKRSTLAVGKICRRHMLQGTGDELHFIYVDEVTENTPPGADNAQVHHDGRCCAFSFFQAFSSGIQTKWL